MDLPDRPADRVIDYLRAGLIVDVQVFAAWLTRVVAEAVHCSNLRGNCDVD
jgi:hypothetical protein